MAAPARSAERTAHSEEWTIPAPERTSHSEEWTSHSREWMIYSLECTSHSRERTSHSQALRRRPAPRAPGASRLTARC